MKTSFTSSSSWFASTVIVGLFVCCTVATQVSAQLNCVTAPSGLVSWWRGENSTADAADGNTGTWAGFGNTNIYGPGVVGQAFVFDGTHRDRVDLGNPTNLQLQNFTIEAWIKRSSPTVTSFDFNGADGSVAGEGAVVFGYGRGGYVFAILNNGRVLLGRTDIAAVISVGVVSDTNWHHVAVTKSGSNVVFYIDGTPESVPTPFITTFTFDTSTSIGSRGDARGGTFYGIIDEPAIFGRALSTSEVQAIYNAGSAGKCVSPPSPTCVPAPDNLVSWWRGESNALDAAGTNNGTLVNGVTYEQGMVGLAFRFGTASGQRVWVPDSPAFQLTNSLTIEGWFKIYGGCALVQRGDNRPGLDPFTLAVQSDGKLDFQITHSYNAGDSIHLLTPAAVPTNVWKHLAATLDGTTGAMRIYVDGQVVVETNTTVRPLGPLDPAYDASLSLGNCAGHSIEYPFVGLADEVGIYSRALSAAEIQAIYNASDTGKCAPPPPPPACVPAPDNLVSWWRGEANALDQVGGNNGALINGATFAVGKVGQGFSFNGVNQFVQVATSPSLNLTNEFTLELWYNDLGSSQPYSFIAKRDTGAGAGPCNFGFNVNGGTMFLYFLDSALPGFRGATYPPPAAGVFHHLAGSYRQVDASNVELKIFVDGQLVTTQVVAGNLARSVNTNVVTIGADNPTGSFFHGIIDEPTIYNRALSTNEIQAIYNAGSLGKCVGAVAPFITTQPANQTVIAGATVNFNVTAGGSQPLSHQWRLAGTNISGATTATLTLTNVQLANAGTYSVVVSNSVDTATSSNAVLTVNPLVCADVSSGLVSWWKGESNVLDQLGGNNGNLVGNAGFASGEVGQGFSFDGAGSYVQIPASASLNLTNEITLECWYNDLGSTDFYGLIAKSSASGVCNFGLHVRPSGPQGVQIYFFDQTIGYGTSEYTPVPAAGVFHHVAATFKQVDSSHVELTTFIDGQGVKKVVVSGNLANAINSEAVTIGAERGGGGVSSFFRGVIDEPAIYNRALSTNEIQAIYNAGSLGKCIPTPPPTCVPAPDNPVGWWRGENNALDQVGGNNGTLMNGATFGAGKAGQGFSLIGVNQFVQVPASPPLNLTNEFTLELWHNDLGSSQPYSFMAKRDIGAGAGPCNFGFNVNGGTMFLYFLDSALPGFRGATYPPPAAGVFHHLAGSYRQVDASNVELKIFVDGQLVKTQVVAGNLARSVNTNVVTIGADNPTGSFFHGIIDEPTIYNRALSTSEIQAIYNAGSAGKCTPLPPVNHPPVADATATKPLLIVPAGCSSTVVLDGSRSSDPDADPLQYFWFKTGETNAFATGVVAVVTLPLGAQTLTLVVDDGLATDAQTFAVELITPAQAVERLMALVNSQAPKPHPLIATLSAALAAIERGHVTPAINQLEAFQNKVRAQVVPDDPALARQFIRAAQHIIDALSRDCASARPHGRIGNVHRHVNGKVKMEFSAPQGWVYLIETSTNLVDWEQIGVAIETGPDEFEFEDPDAAHVPTRFYRIVVP